MNLNARQRSNQKFMMNVYNNLNSNNLVVVYIASHRPGNGLTLDVLYGEDGFNIHSLVPAQYTPHNDQGISVEGIRTIDGFDMPHLPIPKVNPELEEELKKYWRSMSKAKSFHESLRNQGKKHLKFNQLGDQDVIQVGLVLGKELVSEKGKHFLMGILEKYGYRAGTVYPCKKFAEDLGNEFGGVKVTFRLHPDGHALNVKYLHEVHVLYTSDARHRIMTTRVQSFDNNDVFLLEDLRVRRKTTMFCTPSTSQGFALPGKNSE